MPQPRSKPVLIDTDPGIDDALALALAFNSPELHICAVTTVAGNADIATVTRNAALLLPLFGASELTPLIRGAGKPRRGPLRDAKDFHGADGLGGWTTRQREGSDAHAVRAGRAAHAIVKAAREHGQALTLIALGPLTNVARAVDLDADAMRGIGRIVAMGGAIRTAGNVTPLSEFNFHADPAAALHVLDAGLSVTLVPLDVTHQVRLTQQALTRALAGRTDRRARALRTMAKHAFVRQPHGFALHDPLAVALAIEPQLVSCETLPLDVVTGPMRVAGATVEDRRAIDAPYKVGAWTKTALAVDVERMLALFSERLFGEPVLHSAPRHPPRRVTVVGGLNMDYVVRGPTLPRVGETVTGDTLATFPGGKGANQAVAASRAGAGVTLIGRLGNDPDGTVLAAALNAARVQLATGQPARVRTGAALITVDASGQNQISVAPGANLHVNTRQIRANTDIIASAAVLLCQFEVPMNAVLVAMRIAQKHGTYTILNPSPVRTLPDLLAPRVDLLIANEVEAQAFTGLPVATRAQATAAITALHALGFRAVVLTLGARGALWSSGSARGFEPARRVQAIDSTAAGDTFAGYTAAALAAGHSLADAIKQATVAAALCVQKAGAQPSIPTLRQTRRALANQGH